MTVPVRECQECEQRRFDSWRSDVVPRVRLRWYGFVYEEQPGMIPHDGYGLAAQDYQRGVNLYMPIPLNVIVAAWRAVQAWFKYPRRFIHRDQMTQALQAEYQRGCADASKWPY